MIEPSRKRIVVVLGMHRSGTSAVTRGLQVLGVDLGRRLMPPAPDNNETGFWEDIDIADLDRDLLVALGHEWHSLGPILSSEFISPHVEDFAVRAAKLLREKLSSTDCLGIKDPRMCRLLPFWQSVFAREQLAVSYVISCRHPKSVAKSMAMRD